MVDTLSILLVHGLLLYIIFRAVMADYRQKKEESFERKSSNKRVK